MREYLNKFELWWKTYAFCFLLVVLQSLIRRRKMSHNNGIAAAGKLRIVSNPEFPEADFFEPGREFACRIRHATASMMDDAMLTVKGASIKFSDNPVESPLDIEMNTGRSLFWSAANFFTFGRNQHEHQGISMFRITESIQLAAMRVKTQSCDIPPRIQGWTTVVSAHLSLSQKIKNDAMSTFVSYQGIEMSSR